MHAVRGAYALAFVSAAAMVAGQSRASSEPGSFRKLEPLAGVFVVAGKQICSFDAKTAADVPWRILDKDEARPEAWVQVRNQPTVAVRLSQGSPNRLTLLGPGETLVRVGMRIQQTAASPFSFEFKFGGSLAPGEYELGGYEGTRPLFFRCGFTVTE